MINYFQGNMSFQLYLSVQFLDPVHLFICLVCVCMSVRVHVCVTCAYGYVCVCVWYMCIWVCGCMHILSVHMEAEENVWCPLLSSLSHSFEKGLSLNLELAKSQLSFYQSSSSVHPHKAHGGYKHWYQPWIFMWVMSSEPRSSNLCSKHPFLWPRPQT